MDFFFDFFSGIGIVMIQVQFVKTVCTSEMAAILNIIERIHQNYL